MKGNGAEEFSVKFWISGNEYSGEYFYMVSLPEYEDETREPEVQKELKKQIGIGTGEEGYDFRVTEKQYYQLTKRYDEIDRSPEKDTVELSYFLPEMDRVHRS